MHLVMEVRTHEHHTRRMVLAHPTISVSLPGEGDYYLLATRRCQVEGLDRRYVVNML